MKKLYPIRCFTCGKVLKNRLYEELKKEEDKLKFFEKNKIERLCCRKILFSSKGVNILK